MGPQMIDEHVSAMTAEATYADARLMAVTQRGLTPFTRTVRKFRGRWVRSLLLFWFPLGHTFRAAADRHK